MTVEPGWVLPGIDTTKANIARVYDYWLGGSNNFRAMARANRGFLGRAVWFLATEAGIRQFADTGSRCLSPGSST